MGQESRSRSVWRLGALLTVIPVTCFASSLVAQRGTVRGVVVDGLTGEPLPSARVQVMSAGASTFAGDGGRFVIEHLEPGTYTMEVSAGGYSQRQLRIGVESAGVLDLSVRLLPLFHSVPDRFYAELEPAALCGSPTSGQLMEWARILQDTLARRPRLPPSDQDLVPLRDNHLCSLIGVVALRYLDQGLSDLLHELGVPLYEGVPRWDMALASTTAIVQLRSRQARFNDSTRLTLTLLLLIDVPTMHVIGFLWI